MVELLLAMPAAVAAEVTVALVVTVLLWDTAATMETGGLGTGSSGLLTTGTSEPRQQHIMIIVSYYKYSLTHPAGHEHCTVGASDGVSVTRGRQTPPLSHLWSAQGLGDDDKEARAVQLKPIQIHSRMEMKY